MLAASVVLGTAVVSGVANTGVPICTAGIGEVFSTLAGELPPQADSRSKLIAEAAEVGEMKLARTHDDIELSVSDL